MPMLHPLWLLVAALIALGVSLRLRAPLPIALIAASIIAAFLAGFGFPLRHLVEGGFGYINLILALFAGAFFGQMMIQAGAAEALAERVNDALGNRPLPVLLAAGALLFIAGMFVGIAGVAVLATGVFVVPMLRRLGLEGSNIAAFIAVLATCGMIAPPLNTPAMAIADGVNMPYAAFSGPLLLLSLPPALLAVLLTARAATGVAAVQATVTAGAARIGILSLGVVMGFWTFLRLFPMHIPDPAVPLVLVVGGLIALASSQGRRHIGPALTSAFSGTPLMLAAVLVAVGVTVQIMTLTGIRGLLVINTMSFPEELAYLALFLMPLIGGVLTAAGAANVLGVPFAFAFIHQDMIINVSAISSIAALSEFAPPTAISAALASYIVGDARLLRVLRHALLPAVMIAVIAILMLVFADDLTSVLRTGGVGPREH